MGGPRRRAGWPVPWKSARVEVLCGQKVVVQAVCRPETQYLGVVCPPPKTQLPPQLRLVCLFSYTSHTAHTHVHTQLPHNLTLQRSDTSRAERITESDYRGIGEALHSVERCQLQQRLRTPLICLIPLYETPHERVLPEQLHGVHCGCRMSPIKTLPVLKSPAGRRHRATIARARQISRTSTATQLCPFSC
jgi:hypothetical protein